LDSLFYVQANIQDISWCRFGSLAKVVALDPGFLWTKTRSSFWRNFCMQNGWQGGLRRDMMPNSRLSIALELAYNKWELSPILLPLSTHVLRAHSFLTSSSAMAPFSASVLACFFDTRPTCNPLHRTPLQILNPGIARTLDEIVNHAAVGSA
jgi:hypothetical protein